MSTNIDNLMGSSFAQESMQEAQRAFLQKVYAWMLGGLLLTAGISYLTFSSEPLWDFATTMRLPLILVELGLVIALSAFIQRFSSVTAGIMFIVYSALNGITLSAVFARYVSDSIILVFLISALMFGAMSLYGYLTKRDLSGVGSFMFMGLIGIVVASLINIWIGSPALYFAVSFIGVLVFTGLTAYDTQKIKEMYLVEVQGGEVATKAAVLGALSLYLDFINLFLMLLRLFGSRR